MGTGRPGEGESWRQWGTKAEIKGLKKKQRKRKEKLQSYNKEYTP